MRRGIAKQGPMFAWLMVLYLLLLQFCYTNQEPEVPTDDERAHPSSMTRLEDNHPSSMTRLEDNHLRPCRTRFIERQSRRNSVNSSPYRGM
jgi:hypothetical protein